MTGHTTVRSVLALPQLSVPRDSLHVFWLDVSAAGPAVRAFAQVLDYSERIQAENFHFAQDRLRYIVAHGALRHILAAYCGGTPGALRFRREHYGKPALDAEGTPAFNLSHSGARLMVAVAREGRAVGVDVEQMQPMSRIAQLAKTIAGDVEFAGLTSLPPRDREPAFFDLWTRKEAVVKATGEGLARGLREVVVGSGRATVLLAGMPALGVRSLDCGAGYAAAIAADAPLGEVEMTQLVCVG